MSWRAKTDPSTGKQYYYNKDTKETTWTRPADFKEELPQPPSPASSTAPTHGASANQWLEKVDAASGKTYYYHPLTKETTWVKPAELLAQQAAPLAEATPKAQGAASPSPQRSSDVGDAASLPTDWVSRTDPASGKMYYYNAKTKETSWTKPVAAAASLPSPNKSTPAPAAESDDPWIAKQDPASGKTYYINKITKETSWTNPNIVDSNSKKSTANSNSSNEAAAPATASSSVAPPTQGTSPRMQSRWVERVDPASGKTYYYNSETKETSWTRPSEQPEAASLSTADTLPQNWALVTPKDGKPYYYNKLTKETSWTRPSSSSGPSPPPGGSAGNQRTSNVTSGSPTLQTTNNGAWVQRVDHRTGQWMYVNTITGETQWTDPNEQQPELNLPLSVETMYCLGGNERPPLSEMDAAPPNSLYSSVEMYDTGTWLTLQNSDFDPRRTKNPSALATPPLPVDLEAVTVVRLNHSECLYFGKRADDKLPLCMQWNVETKRVTPRPDLNGLVAYGAAYGTVPNGVVATGGYLDESSMKSVASDTMLMNFATCSPLMLPKMNFPRANHAIAIVDLSNSERLVWFAFVFGGFDGERKSKTVERYVLGKPSWEVMSDMPLARSGHCAVTVNRSIYVIGGRSGYRVLSEVHFMHVQSDTWNTAKSMNQPRCNFGAVCMGSLLIVAGGWDGTRYLNSVEAYDPRIDVWRRVTSLASPKQHFGLVVLRRVDRSDKESEDPKNTQVN